MVRQIGGQADRQQAGKQRARKENGQAKWTSWWAFKQTGTLAGGL